MDALSDVLRVAHLTGGVFLHADFFAPWCMAARVAPEHCAPVLGPASHLILYHYVVEGELRVRVDGEDGEELVLGAGDVVLLPRNDLHLVGSDLTLPPVAGSDIIQPPKDGGLFSIHHGGGVGIGRSIHAGQVSVADGTPLAAQKLERVLTNDPGMGVIRHVDAGYELASEVAVQRGVRIPMQESAPE